MEYKKGLNEPDNHDGVITYLEPDILECEVKWALALSNPTGLKRKKKRGCSLASHKLSHFDDKKVVLLPNVSLFE